MRLIVLMMLLSAAACQAQNGPQQVSKGKHFDSQIWGHQDGTVDIVFHKNSEEVDLVLNGIGYSGKIINRRLVLDGPYRLTYRRRMITVTNNKTKSSYTTWWAKPIIQLPNLKAQ